jgi:hypothetical protein
VFTCRSGIIPSERTKREGSHEGSRENDDGDVERVLENLDIEKGALLHLPNGASENETEETSFTDLYASESSASRRPFAVVSSEDSNDSTVAGSPSQSTRNGHVAHHDTTTTTTIPVFYANATVLLADLDGTCVSRTCVGCGRSQLNRLCCFSSDRICQMECQSRTRCGTGLFTCHLQHHGQSCSKVFRVQGRVDW